MRFDWEAATKAVIMVVMALIIVAIPIVYALNMEERISTLEMKVISLELRVNSNKLLAQQTMRKVVSDNIALEGETNAKER